MTRTIRACDSLCGYGSLLLLGLQPPADVSGTFSARRLLAVALSLAATGFFMVLLKVAHAPAGATTVIVSLGVITRFFHLLVLEIAVALFWVQAILFNRLVGVSYPIWAGKIDSAMEEVINVHGRQRLQEHNIRGN